MNTFSFDQIWFQTKCLDNLIIFSLGMENLIFDQPAACNLQSVLEGTFIIIYIYINSVKTDIMDMHPNAPFLCTNNQDSYLGLPGTTVPPREDIQFIMLPKYNHSDL